LKISILGSTGSIGQQALDVAKRLGIEVVALACGTSIDIAEEQAKEFNPALVSVSNPDKALELSRRFASKGQKTEVMTGRDGLLQAASIAQADVALNAIVGVKGLEPTMAALSAGKNVALANKETLVAAGALVMAKAKEKGLAILPVDSEHSAIFQCLQGASGNRLKKILLTASGGPFRLTPKEELYDMPLSRALKHPNWSMGAKITVDSATMMNKGLEVIEAKWLFSVERADIEVIVHPQSVIHSMIEFEDGSVIAQLGLPDMRLPIQYALTYPKRMPSPCQRLDFFKCKPLEFYPPDLDKFSCLKLAYAALDAGGTAPAVMNAANEEAVAAYISGKIPFGRIPAIIKSVMETYNYTVEGLSLEGVLAASEEARRAARLACAPQ
jgi:1-deoxy-D-xylulose-5-phosphate reductoisomerase